MKKLVLVAVVGLVVRLATVGVFAEEAAKADAPAVAKPAACAECMAGLDALKLTDEQKAACTKAHDECAKAGCGKEAKEKCMKEWEKVLTPEQMKACKEACAKAAAPKEEKAPAAEEKK